MKTGVRVDPSKLQMPKDVNYDLLQTKLGSADQRFFDESWPDDFHVDELKPKQLSKKQLEQAKISTGGSMYENLFQEETAAHEKAKSKLENSFYRQWMIEQNSHTRVTRQGKEQSFSAVVLMGNGEGLCGFGRGRGMTPNDAQEAAVLAATKNFMFVPREEQMALFHSVEGHHNNVRVKLLKRRRGAGIKACPLVHTILTSFGIDDVTTKVLGRGTTLGIVYATFNALAKTVSHRQVSLDRGKNYYTWYEQGKGKISAPTDKEQREQQEKVYELMRESKQALADVAGFRFELDDNGNILDDGEPSGKYQHSSPRSSEKQDREFDEQDEKVGARLQQLHTDGDVDTVVRMDTMMGDFPDVPEPYSRHDVY